MRSDAGLSSVLLGNGLKTLATKCSRDLTGTSVFDPVLCEVIYKWFGVQDGVTFDPFAGGSVRGVVAELSGMRYIGVDLSKEQIQANSRNADELKVYPTWYCDDSRNADKYVKDNSADLVFTCPPYHDLEKYSDNPLDLSNMTYADFIDAYTDIISLSCKKLKDNRFAVFVVGDIRDKHGAYRDFVGDTKRIFRECGLCLYNDCVLLDMYGTAPMRAAHVFEPLKKLIKVHQNVLIFYKGDIQEIRNTYGKTFEWVDLSRYKATA